MKKIILTTSLVIALSACAEPHNVKPSPNGTTIGSLNSYVDSSMADSVSEINNSLKQLTQLDRGVLAKPSNGPLKDSVGYNLENKNARNTQNLVSKTVPQVGTPLYNQQINDQTNLNDELLNKKIKIYWKGSLYDLAQNISNSIGYKFFTSGPLKTIPDITINVTSGDKKTVKDVLGLIADKINLYADVNVNTSPVGNNPKSISFSYKNN